MSAHTITWSGSIPGWAELIDQTLLPGEFKVLSIRTAEEMWEAIKTLRIRGAPAIGVAAAFGLVLGVQKAEAASPQAFQVAVKHVSEYLRTARPTAVNLFWALDRMERRAAAEADRPVEEQKASLLAEAQEILREDTEKCRQIGEHGAPIISEGSGVLTHCNAGALATSAHGTALSVMYTAHERGTNFRVFADETRPLLQGARLTAWELGRAGVDVTLICDNMAGVVMREGKVQTVVVGADRIAANGDVANKIGTYTVSILAREHDVAFYVAAPLSTFDLDVPDGAHIPIEERAEEEITEPYGTRTAPRGVKVYNPAFDITSRALVRGIITEYGIVEHPDTERIEAFFRQHCPERLASIS